MARKRSRAARKKHRQESGRSAVDALLALTNAPLTIESADSLFEEMWHTKSNRSAGILAATFVESALETAIERQLVWTDLSRNKIFGINRPLGSFSAKADFATILGIIGSETYGNIEKIRAIRNAFAHAKTSITFRTKQVSDVCRLLKIPITLNPFHRPDAYADSARGRFMRVCYVTSTNLLIFAMAGRVKLSDKQAIPVPEFFEAVMLRKTLP